MARVYATEADLVAYGAPPGVTLPTGPEATRQLTRASEKVDDLLFTAVYDTDTDGRPTKPAVVEALQLATCAQVVWWLVTGDESGTGARYQSVSIGSVTLSRGSGGTGSATSETERVSADAVNHLRRAGLLPGVVITAAC